MKVLITGANGFIGSHLLEHFCVHGHDVRAAARTRFSPGCDGATWVASPNLEPNADWAHALENIEVVVHCAARVHVTNDTATDPLAEFRRVNRGGTMALARAAAAAGAKRFIFLSSIKVNGESSPRHRSFRADDEPTPSDPYGISKLEAERDLLSFARVSGMEVVIIRPVLVYGPGVGANFRAMMRAVASGIPLPLGAVNNLRSLLFVGNLASLVHRTADHPAAPGNVFLVSDGSDVSTSDMLRMIASAMGRPARLLPAPTSAMSLAARLVGKRAVARRLFSSLTVDIGPTRDVLEWEPPFPVELGFAQTVAAYCAERHSGP